MYWFLYQVQLGRKLYVLLTAIHNNNLVSIEVNDNEVIDCNNLFLCIGHSARDTFRMLFNNKINMCNKSFAVGFRVSHLQKDISYSMYGDNYKYLDPAYYKLTYNSKDRGVYSFCMCPGGYVVNSSSEVGKLVVNGMSNYDRSSDTANSAIVVTVNSKDYGDNPLDGIKFQEELEEKAFKLGNGLIPVQKYIDFKNNEKTTSIDTIINTCGGYSLSNLRGLLSEELNKSFIEGMEYFASKIDGFNKPDTILYGIESRTSSPVRIIRDENGLSNIDGIYPTGEGAGYAGGITSSAVDGIKQVEKFVSKYSPFV